MHTLLGRIFRYVLWFILAFVVLLLFIGLAKQNWDFKGYIQSLNERSRSEARQQGGISSVFWGVNSTIVGEDIGGLSGELFAGDSVSETGMDVYDPSFEEDLNQIPDTTLSSGDYGDTTTDFGFVQDGSVTGSADASITTSTTASSGSKSQQLLDLLKREGK